MTPSGGGASFDAKSAPAPSTAGYAPQPGYPAPPPPFAESAPAQGGTPGDMGSAQKPAPEPEDRPGLGTEWGETRESHIREVAFFRADPDRPFAVADLFYNDWQGVQALASFHGGPRFRDIPAAGGAITVSIRNAYGEPLEAMHVGDRTYVIGQEGERYTIRIENHTPRTFEAVATVDGLDVMNGHAGTFANRGYVIGAWDSLDIDGFRQSEDEVAAFRFAKVRDSYAAQTGDARNVGVIGVAFFAQRGDDWNVRELQTRDTASPFPRESRFARAPH
ncbi:MAG TPA: hypothetical protein VF765_29345 [Polyangiaceae bacterium]